MHDRFDLPLMVRDSLADWKAQLRRRFPGAPSIVVDALTPFFVPFALRFALEMRSFHGRIGKIGLGSASLELLKRYYAGVETRSDIEIEALRGRLSAGGPLLVLANHPGIVDTLALFHCLETVCGLRDFLVVANERDFFAAMPAVQERIIPVPADAAGRAAVLGRMENALRGGRSVVLYPSGDITSDPGLAPGVYAQEELLGTWSPSVGLLLARLRRPRKTGETPIGGRADVAVLPVLCGGVLPNGIADAWWMGKKRSRRDREALAVGAVLAFRVTRRATVAVRVGEPIDLGKELAGLSPKEIGAEVYLRTMATAIRLSADLRSGDLRSDDLRPCTSAT